MNVSLYIYTHVRVSQNFASILIDMVSRNPALQSQVNWLVRNSLLPFVDLAPSPQTALDRPS